MLSPWNLLGEGYRAGFQDASLALIDSFIHSFSPFSLLPSLRPLLSPWPLCLCFPLSFSFSLSFVQNCSLHMGTGAIVGFQEKTTKKWCFCLHRTWSTSHNSLLLTWANQTHEGMKHNWECKCINLQRRTVLSSRFYFLASAYRERRAGVQTCNWQVQGGGGKPWERGDLSLLRAPSIFLLLL